MASSSQAQEGWGPSPTLKPYRPAPLPSLNEQKEEEMRSKGWKSKAIVAADVRRLALVAAQSIRVHLGAHRVRNSRIRSVE